MKASPSGDVFFYFEFSICTGVNGLGENELRPYACAGIYWKVMIKCRCFTTM